MLRDLMRDGARAMLLKKYILLLDKENNKNRIEKAKKELEGLKGGKGGEGGGRKKGKGSGRGGGGGRGGEGGGGSEGGGSKKRLKKKGNELTLTQMVDMVIGKTEEDEEEEPKSYGVKKGGKGGGGSGGDGAKDGDNPDSDCDESGDKKEEGDAYELRFCDSVIVLHPTHGCQDSTSLTRVLQELQPHTVIMHSSYRAAR